MRPSLRPMLRSRSPLGFIELAAGEMMRRQERFEAAVGSDDAALGEPHLGLGLLYFRSAL